MNFENNIKTFYVSLQNGDTPLHIACRQRHTVIIRYLLSNGADITLMNKHNFTPLDEYVVVNYEDVLIKLSKKTEDGERYMLP